MNDSKYTVQQFGALIKEKYPQYAKIPDEELGKRTLDTHPEYMSRIQQPAVINSTASLPPTDPNMRPSDKLAEAGAGGVGNFIANNLKDAAGQITTEFGGGPGSIAGKIVKNVQDAGTDIRTGIENKDPILAGKGIVKGAFRTAGDLAGAVYTVPGALLTATGLPKIFEYVADLSQKGGDKNPINMITNMKSVQDFVTRHPNLEADFTRALNLALSAADGGKIDPKTIIERTKEQFASKTTTPPPGGTPSDTTKPAPEGSSVASSIAKEVIPSADRLVNYAVTRAFDLTQGDVRNISFSTGHEPGKFLAENNLIGRDASETKANIEAFRKENYERVRDEISLVDGTFKTDSIPRYKEALGEIKKAVDGVPGLEKVSAEVNSLLRKRDAPLMDVQRVKELMDEHFNLYKVTGDVKESAAKEGLANIRHDLKEYIENRVKDATGVDIKPLNNNVQTTRSIADAIETRSTAGLTKSHIKIGDLGMFGMGSAMGGPLVGLALLFGKKVIESPTFGLRFSRWLDGLSDTQRTKVKTDLERGVVPEPFKEEVQADAFPPELGSGPMEMGTYKLKTNKDTGVVDMSGEYRPPGINFYPPKPKTAK